MRTAGSVAAPQRSCPGLLCRSIPAGIKIMLGTSCVKSRYIPAGIEAMLGSSYVKMPQNYSWNRVYVRNELCEDVSEC